MVDCPNCKEQIEIPPTTQIRAESRQTRENGHQRSRDGKKMFFSVFFAILAAALVIGLALAARQRYENWEKAKDACLSAIAALNNIQNESYEDSKGGNLYELTAALKTMDKAQGEIANVEQRLITVLQAKSFFRLREMSRKCYVLSNPF